MVNKHSLHCLRASVNSKFLKLYYIVFVESYIFEKIFNSGVNQVLVHYFRRYIIDYLIIFGATLQWAVLDFGLSRDYTKRGALEGHIVPL